MDQQLPEENKNLDTQKAPKKGFKLPFSKTILIPAVIIAVLLVIGTILVLTGMGGNKTEKTPEEKAIEQIENLPGSILFEPATLTASPGRQMSVDLTLNTGGHAINGAVIAVKYNPNVIGNVSIEQLKDPNSAISSTFEVSGQPLYDEGGALMTLRLPEGTQALKGVGKIATLKFTPKRINVALPTTTIELLPLTNFLTPVGSSEVRVTTNSLMLQYE